MVFVFLFGFTVAGASTYYAPIISQVPQKSYAAVSDINDFYATKLARTYISFGGYIVEGTLNGSKGIIGALTICGQNPALCITKNIRSFASVQSYSVDVVSKKTIAVVDNAHVRTFAFVSGALDFRSTSSDQLKYQIGQSGENLAQVISAPQSIVDKAGSTIYITVNSWFNKTSGTIASIFAKKTPVIVVNPVSSTSLTSSIDTKSKNVQPVQNYNPAVVTKNVTTVIERVVQVPVLASSKSTSESYDALQKQIADLSISVNNRFAGLSFGGGGNVTNIYQQIANSQRIDQLHNTVINNPTIHGGSIDNMNSIAVGTINSGTINT
ncbi:MAG: hypothetical protein ACYC19_11885, partial [Acidimicrobiales bacterium]